MSLGVEGVEGVEGIMGGIMAGGMAGGRVEGLGAGAGPKPEQRVSFTGCPMRSLYSGLMVPAGHSLAAAKVSQQKGSAGLTSGFPAKHLFCSMEVERRRGGRGGSSARTIQRQ